MSLSREAEYSIHILPYRKVYTGQSSHDVNALLGGASLLVAVKRFTVFG